jgi:hypothetical protein
MSEDGSVVAFSEGLLGTIVVVDVASGDRIAQIDPHAAKPSFGPAEGANWSVQSVNHDGTLVATGTRRVVVWAVATGEVVSILEENSHDGRCSEEVSRRERSGRRGRPGGPRWLWVTLDAGGVAMCRTGQPLERSAPSEMIMVAAACFGQARSSAVARAVHRAGAGHGDGLRPPARTGGGRG